MPFSARRGEQGAAGIIQPHQLGGLVERLTGRIIDGLPQHFVVTDPADTHQQGVSAGDQQRHKREFRRIIFQHRGQQVSFHMVHAHRGLVPRKRQAAADGRPHQQSAHQARTTGISDPVDIILAAPGMRHRFLDQRDGLTNMITRRQLWYDAAVIGVQLHLTVQPVRHQPLLDIIDSYTGLVARRFYT